MMLYGADIAAMRGLAAGMEDGASVLEWWSNANTQHDMWIDSGHKPIPQAKTLPGDVIYFDYQKDQDFDHAMVVRAVGPAPTPPSR